MAKKLEAGDVIVEVDLDTLEREEKEATCCTRQFTYPGGPSSEQTSFGTYGKRFTTPTMRVTIGIYQSEFDITHCPFCGKDLTAED